MKRVCLLLVLLVVGVHAATNMWARTGQAYGIEPRLLYAISKVESNLRPLVVSVNFTKITKTQRDKLYGMLQSKRIPYHTFTKVIEIDNQNISQAEEVINFLDTNRYASFDIGLMQINNIHKETLKTHKISLHTLLNEDTNLNVAAGILWECYKKNRTNYKTISAYNGSKRGNAYYTKVSAELQKLLLPHESSSKRLFYRVL
ncbi:MAG: lytic transglycosylase domain-containing protein [Sulfurimonas sp.]|nr:lytic transglycosylase domain-containing protein [Sulfurimonas sp.]MBU4111219.1 lytic transglycosylase domain-containing protein [bacterium]